MSFYTVKVEKPLKSALKDLKSKLVENGLLFEVIDNEDIHVEIDKTDKAFYLFPTTDEKQTIVLSTSKKIEKLLTEIIQGKEIVSLIEIHSNPFVRKGKFKVVLIEKR